MAAAATKARPDDPGQMPPGNPKAPTFVARGPLSGSGFVDIEDLQDPAARHRQLAVSYAVAAILELMLIFGLWHILATPSTAAPADDDMAMTIVEPPAPPPPPPVPIIQEQLKPIVPKLIHPLIKTPRLAIPSPMALPVDDEPPQPPSPPPPPPPAPSAAAINSFQSALRAAIQAAIIYPPAAKMMKQQGRTKVAFTLWKGAADSPRVIESSGIASIDQAAIAAVLDAHYPEPPPELAGRPLTFAVYVDFNLTTR